MPGGWLDEHTLLGSVPAKATYLLDLRSGRMLLRDFFVPYDLLSDPEPDEDYWYYFEPPGLSDPLAEDAVPGFCYVSSPLRRVGDRTVSLGMSGPHLDAATRDLAPRFLLLARNASLVPLRRDGRTLFFKRAGALWRMDLRKPVPELLDEIQPPELPPLGEDSRTEPLSGAYPT